ncbi:hypothetical protein [Streptomyces sp. NPDC094466]
MVGPHPRTGNHSLVLPQGWAAPACVVAAARCWQIVNIELSHPLLGDLFP